MAIMTAQEYQEKQARNLKNASQDIIAGINRVDKAPTLQAAEKKNKMLTKLTEAVNKGKWEAGLRRVTLEDWRKKTAEVGVPRISAGIDAAADKVVGFATEFLPFVDGISKKVRAMPDQTIDDSINRMTTQVRETSKFKRSA